MRGGLARERPPTLILGLLALAGVVKLAHIAMTDPLRAVGLVVVGAILTALVALAIRYLDT